jgi:tetratricopeptide (TPR) repeat protein
MSVWFRAMRRPCRTGFMRNVTLLWVALLSCGITGFAIGNHIQESERFLAAGNLEAAEREAKLALSSPETKALACAMLGTIRLQQNRDEEGIEYLEKAITLEPRLVGARLNLGSAYARLGRTDKARRAYRDALRVQPDSTPARLGLAQLEAAAGNYATSLQLAEPMLVQLRKTPEGILLLATDYSGLKKRDQLALLVGEWRKLGKIPESKTLEFADVLSRGGFTAEAIEVVKGQTSANENPSFETTFALAGLYARQGNTKLATDYYESALKQQEGCVPCLRGLAAIARSEGITEKALAYLIRARKVAPEDPDVLFEFGRVCLERNLFEDGVEALEKAVALRPDNDHYRYVLASGYTSLAHYAKARAILEALVTKHPNDSALNYALGSVVYLMADFDTAEALLRKSIELNADQVGSYYYLGLIAEKRKDLPAAEQIFRRLLKEHPEHVPSYAWLGTVLVEMKKYSEAQPVLEEAIRRDPSSVQAHFQLGILLGRLGKQEESAKEVEIARVLEKKQVHELNMLPRILP